MLLAGPAAADQLQLPAVALDRIGSVMALWRPGKPAAGTLLLDWTDGAGRLLERHRVILAEPVPQVAVPLDLRRADSLANHVSTRFQPNEAGPQTQAEADFVARPAPGWPQYQVIMWQDQSPAALAGLHALGITAVKSSYSSYTPSATAQERTAPLVAAGLRWYVENIATDFYASYHRWMPDFPVTWRFAQAKALHRERPDDVRAFYRVPSLSDPAWLATVTARLEEAARIQLPYRPLFLNLGDESGIGDLAAAWDFDLSPPSLAGMRAWLKERYDTLTALNKAWGTKFLAWDAVEPALTDDALRNEAAVPAWMDFKAWMDVAFARAVRAGTDAVHRGDPEALAALEGAQVPGWGGYDYGKLAAAVDAMEIYDYGNAVEITHSLNPALRILTTSFKSGPAERHRLWHEWLLGARGTIIWDEKGDVIRPDGQPGPRGADLGPVWRELDGALGAQFLNAEPAPSQVAILYSQASFRLGWLLARRAGGEAWVKRDAEAEYADNAWRAATRRAAAILADLGAQPRWVTPETLTAGTLTRDGTRLLVLPHSIAMSDAEIAAVRSFAKAGGLVLADVPPGERDALGHIRTAPPLADLASGGHLEFPAMLRNDGAAPDTMVALLAKAGVRLPLTLLETDGRPAANLDVRFFRSGGVLLAGIQRLDDKAGPRDIVLHLPERLWVRSLRDSAPAALTNRLPLHLDPVEPVLLVLSPTPPPTPTLAGPTYAAPGDLVTIRVGLDGPTSSAAHFMQLQVFDATGRVISALSKTVQVSTESAVWCMSLALNDSPGPWQVRGTDVLSGRTASTLIQVR